MTRILKGAATAGMVALYPPQARGAGAADGTGRAVHDNSLQVALAEIARLQAASAAAEAALPGAAAAARAEGRREGAAAAAAAENRRVHALAEGMAAAAARTEEALAGVERLALLVARTALGRLVASDAALAGLVAGSIARQMEQLRREVVSVIRVSVQDFPDEAALGALASDAGTGSVKLVADPDLGAGECRMDLLLGHLDLGVQSRWREVAALLDRMADEEAGG